MSDEILNVLIAVISVIIGFFLSESSFFIKKTRDRKRLVSTFSSELNSIKSSLKEQINANYEFIDGLKEYKFKNPRITIGSNVEYIQTLERLTITNYYMNRIHQDDGKKIRTIYNNLSVIQFEIKRFNKYLDEFNSIAREAYESYNKSIDKIMRFIADILPRNDGESMRMDPRVKDLISFLNNKLLNKGSIQDIIPNKSDLHTPLFELCDALHDYTTIDFKKLIGLNQEAYDILKRYIIRMDGFKNNMMIINESLERSYDRIYK